MSLRAYRLLGGRSKRNAIGEEEGMPAAPAASRVLLQAVCDGLGRPGPPARAPVSPLRNPAPASLLIP